MKRCALVLLLALASQVSAATSTVHGWVSWVMDGDTVLLVPDGGHEPIKLRIEGIDAPESCQPGGDLSAHADRLQYRYRQTA